MKKVHQDNIVNLIKFVNTKYKEVTLFNILIFKKLSSFFYRVAVNKRIWWLYFEFLINLSIIGVFVDDGLLIEILANDE